VAGRRPRETGTSYDLVLPFKTGTSCDLLTSYQKTGICNKDIHIELATLEGMRREHVFRLRRFMFWKTRIY
jgi:hypothetical protein